MRRSVSGCRFQSTPPRGGRPLCTLQHRLRNPVSIHAPARGATAHLTPESIEPYGFNPRPREGATSCPLWKSLLAEVQSTPPRGGRHDRVRQKPLRHIVSIHAPARGATPAITLVGDAEMVFQSTPPRGGRPARAAVMVDTSEFQSTPPRGGRPGCHSASWPHNLVSIHAPARGATSASGEQLIKRLVSIHAPARGATGSDGPGPRNV